MAKIIRLTESDLNRIVRKILNEQTTFPVPGIEPGTQKYPFKKPIRKAPPKKVRRKVAPVKACRNQVGEAYKLFKGSNINLYRDGADMATEKPVYTQVCINSILPLSSNILKVGASNDIVRMFSKKNGFILFTDKKDEGGRTVMLYFECGSKFLVNENLTNIKIASNTAATAFGGQPMISSQENVTQENVIKALENMCSVNPKGQVVPKVQNPKFASNQQTGTDYV